MDVYIESEIGVCQEFIGEKSSKKEAVSIVISPIKVQHDENQMTLRVINGCNMWRGCFNKNCFYSSAARKEPKLKAQDQS